MADSTFSLAGSAESQVIQLAKSLQLYFRNWSNFSEKLLSLRSFNFCFSFLFSISKNSFSS